MSAIIALIVIFIWAGFGFVIWKCLVDTYIRSTILKTCLTLLLAVVWFIGPVFDEILGAREFDQLCREMPQKKFHGPVAVGPGVFFDEQGRKKWKNSDEFSAIKRKTDVWWKEIFDSRDEKRVLRKWPMPIIESHWVIFDRATGKISVEYFSIYSKGGWLRRFIGIGDYQCPSKGRLIRDEETIVFKAN